MTACPLTPNLLSAGGQGFRTCWWTHRTQEAEGTLGTGCSPGNVSSLHRLPPQPFMPAFRCLESSSPDPCSANLISGQQHIPRCPVPLPYPPSHSPVSTLPLSHHDHRSREEYLINSVTSEFMVRQTLANAHSAPILQLGPVTRRHKGSCRTPNPAFLDICLLNCARACVHVCMRACM